MTDNKALADRLNKAGEHVRRTSKGGMEYEAALFEQAATALTATPSAQAGEVVELDRYDAGLLGDFGGGNVEWWQDYLRSELERAHDFYQSQLAPQPQGDASLRDFVEEIGTNGKPTGYFLFSQQGDASPEPTCNMATESAHTQGSVAQMSGNGGVERDKIFGAIDGAIHALFQEGRLVECDRLNAQRPKLARALSTPQARPSDGVICVECGLPTMHIGNICHACSHPKQSGEPAPTVDEDEASAIGYEGDRCDHGLRMDETCNNYGCSRTYSTAPTVDGCDACGDAGYTVRPSGSHTCWKCKPTPTVDGGAVLVSRVDLERVLKNGGPHENMHQSAVDKFDDAKGRLWDALETPITHPAPATAPTVDGGAVGYLDDDFAASLARNGSAVMWREGGMAKGDGVAVHAHPAPAPDVALIDVPHQECYSDGDGDTWFDCPDDAEFTQGRKVGDTYEVQVSHYSIRRTYIVTKVPDDTSDDYEVEPFTQQGATNGHE